MALAKTLASSPVHIFAIQQPVLEALSPAGPLAVVSAAWLAIFRPALRPLFFLVFVHLHVKISMLFTIMETVQLTTTGSSMPLNLEVDDGTITSTVLDW